MSKQTNQDLEIWAQKAAQRLNDKKVTRYRELVVPTFDTTIKIRSLSYAEIVDVTQMEKTGDPNYGDRYTAYIAIVEPDMKALATKLKGDGQISEYIEVVNMFELHELNKIVHEIMDLSGASPNEKTKVTVVEELYNAI